MLCWVTTDFPDLAVEVRFTYDAAAKHIQIDKGNFHFTIDHGVTVQVEKALHQVLMTYYGVGDYVDKIVDALNLRMPTGLPSQLDVTNLQISKSDDTHLKGINMKFKRPSMTALGARNQPWRAQRAICRFQFHE
jgi:hypothetical protein